ncbi:MAG: glycosyltransferase family 4 protein [Bacteroidia bacterium]
MKKTKVLMLGWEYPPAMAGGLGVASAALAEALASRVDLQVITPAWDNLPEKPFLKGVGSPFSMELFPETPYPYLTDEPAQWPISIEKIEVEEEDTLASDLVEENKFQEDSPAVSEEVEAPEPLSPPAIYERALAYAEVVVEEVADSKFDIIHVHDWLTALPGLALQAATGKPLVLHVHALEYDRSGPQARGWIYALECEAMEKADSIIPVSQYMASVMVEHYGISPEKITAIPHGGPDIEPYEKAHAFGGPVVTFVGRLAGQKNPYQVLNLAEQVIAEYPDTTFIVAGEGPERENLILESIKRGLELNVLFMGFLGKEALHDVLAMSDVFFMPSWSEPFGLAAIEAAAFGVPCLLSDRCGAVEILRSAWLTAPDDTAKQAELCMQLLADPDQRAHIGSNLQQEAKSFTWDDAGERIVEAFAALH